MYDFPRSSRARTCSAFSFRSSASQESGQAGERLHLYQLLGPDAGARLAVRAGFGALTTSPVCSGPPNCLIGAAKAVASVAERSQERFAEASTSCQPHPGAAAAQF
jgi:hypothetical protein